MVGWLLKIFVWLIDSWLFPPIRALLQRNNRIPQTLAETDVPEVPLFLPVHDCLDAFVNGQTSQLPAPPEMAAMAFKIPGTVLRNMLTQLHERGGLRLLTLLIILRLFAMCKQDTFSLNILHAYLVSHNTLPYMITLTQCRPTCF